MTSTYPPTTIRGTAVTYIPLTTSFKAPDACSGYFIGVGSEQNSQYTTSLEFLQGWGVGYQIYVNKSVGCFPDEVVSSSLASESALINRYISRLAANDEVGTIRLAPFSCLGGWSSVYSTIEGESSAMTACCPSGYDASIDYYGTYQASITCMSSFKASVGSVVSYAENVSPVNAITATETFTPTFSMYTTTVTGRGSFGMYVSVLAAPISGYNFDPSTATSSSGESPAKQNSGLSTGAKAGIGVGVGVGSLLIIGALLFYLRSRHRSPSNSESKEKSSETPMIAELQEESRPPVPELYHRTDQPELVGSHMARNELAGTHTWPPQELDAPEDHPVRHDSNASTE